MRGALEIAQSTDTWRSNQQISDFADMNIAMAKGLSCDRVLIAPTSGVIDFLRRGTALGEGPGCSLYVAVTRTRHSVAFVADNPTRLRLNVWTP